MFVIFRVLIRPLHAGHDLLEEDSLVVEEKDDDLEDMMTIQEEVGNPHEDITSMLWK